MADRLANHDAEALLQSVRRLVSAESLNRQVAPVTTEPQPEPAEIAYTETDHFVLPQSLRVVSADQAAQQASLESAQATDPVEEEGTEIPVFVPDAVPSPQSETAIPSSFQATIAGLEAAVMNDTAFEPDAGSNDSLATNAPAFFVRSGFGAPQEADAPAHEAQVPDVEDISENEAPESLETPATPAPLQLGPALKVAEPSATSETDDEELILDEAVLDEMIRTIVREELRGALGEGITRNLRKLIRREIQAYFDVGPS